MMHKEELAKKHLGMDLLVHIKGWTGLREHELLQACPMELSPSGRHVRLQFMDVPGGWFPIEIITVLEVLQEPGSPAIQPPSPLTT